ncbi:hypothetical protein AAFX91_37270 [Bradyrhizobium sp. 31Argb]|uniref:hypothetical protein n=1 Tax=Bradyrhizobium sp. 31Argb TaxID=3141247 RepID=UPI003747F775
MLEHPCRIRIGHFSRDYEGQNRRAWFVETQQERSAAVKPMQAPGVRFLQTVTMSFSANPLLAAFGQRRGF